MQAIRAIRTLLSRQEKCLPKLSNFKHYCIESTSEIRLPEVIERRNQLFLEEQKKQLEAVGRVEKIAVDVVGPPEDITLIMNNDISTPYDCAKHISLGLCHQAALALVNDKILWDMHRPLMGNCKLQFLTFKDKDPYNLNKTFWRTGSFILGAVANRAFKDNVKVLLHSFPPPVLKSGSFIYDVYINARNWNPTKDELKILSAEFLMFVQENHKIERLKVKKSIAVEIFKDNPYKLHHAKQIAAEAEDHLVTLYKAGDHIDMSTGPMVANTSFFGRCSVTNVIPLIRPDSFYRFQGIALPKGILLNQYAYSIIEELGAMRNDALPPDCTLQPFQRVYSVVAEKISGNLPLYQV